MIEESFSLPLPPPSLVNGEDAMPPLDGEFALVPEPDAATPSEPA
jgi:hypothetical protein